MPSLVGSEMCIRDRCEEWNHDGVDCSPSLVHTPGSFTAPCSADKTCVCRLPGTGVRPERDDPSSGDLARRRRRLATPAFIAATLRRTRYVKVTEGTCAGAGYIMIADQVECNTAAVMLGLSDTESYNNVDAGRFGPSSDTPPGCYYAQPHPQCGVCTTCDCSPRLMLSPDRMSEPCSEDDTCCLLYTSPSPRD